MSAREGIIDAEGSFSTIVCKDISRKLGWRVEPKFQLGMHIRELSLLRKIQNFFGNIGKIYINKKTNMANYIISSTKDITKLINHIDKYPLLTQKKADYLLFTPALPLTVRFWARDKIITIIKNKSHLTPEGLQQIINIKASMNLGLSDLLKYEFKNYSPIKRPIIETNSIPNNN